MADRKSSLSPSQQKLLTEMQRINCGCIEGLSVRHDEPVLDPPPVHVVAASTGTHATPSSQGKVQLDTNRSTNAQSIVSDPFTVTLIKIKANQFCRRADFSRSDYNDLRQDMRVYLLEKAHLFDPARGTLEAFVISALKTWAAMRVRYRKRIKRFEGLKAVSLESTEVECDGETMTLGDVLLEEDGQRLTRTYPASLTEQFETREAVDHALKGLTPQDRALLADVTEHGITAAAKSRGVSWRQVHNAMARIRRHFEKAGLGPN